MKYNLQNTLEREAFYAGSLAYYDQIELRHNPYDPGVDPTDKMTASGTNNEQLAIFWFLGWKDSEYDDYLWGDDDNPFYP